jgi:thiol:disulfide interchange protein DsbD
MKRLLIFLLLAFAAGPAFGQTVVQTENVRAELLADVTVVRPGQPFWVALRQTIRPKWHTYWKNPGESGLPTEIRWTLPAGVTAEPIVWPTPHLFDIGGVINYGFQDEAMLLVRITPAAGLAGEALKLAAEANWLVCEDVCIPEDGKFELSLPIGQAATPAPPATQAMFDKARHSVPVESPWPARYGIAKSGDPTLIVEAKGLKPDTVRDVYFFPADWGPIASMAKQTASIGADGIRIPLKRGDAKGALPDRLAGTLVLTERTADGDVKQAFDLSAKLDAAFVPTSSLAGAEGSEPLSLVQALLFALLGGLILNLMPCVFPVLAMKAAALARLSGHERSEMRRDGLAYTAGILVSFAAMAAIVIAIRASLGDVSWGFQFQSPIFSLLIAYLFFVIGLNLSGVFEIGGSRLAGVGQGLAGRAGITGSFFTGVLAVVVATPCTAPFMAAALGFALSQPAPQTAAVLLAMGLGLALPYLLLSLTPVLRRLVPKPGAWMERLRQFLAFPMYASAVWMIWVLTQQTGADGVIYALGGMILIAFAIWLLRIGSGTSPAAWLRRGFAAAAVLLAFGAALKLEDGPATAASASGSPVGGVSFEGWERYSRDRLNQAVAARKPVFVDLTAAWCITCLVNERVALETPATRRAFEQAGVVKLKGDWTNRDPEITSLLKELGRAGVPLYLWWPPGAAQAKILPQVLTESMMLSELSSIQ